MAATRKTPARSKTIANDRSVNEFLAQVEPQRRRADARILLNMFESVTGERAKMWGPSIVGFGQYHYCLLYTSPSPRDS